jgi:ferredoxin
VECGDLTVAENEHWTPSDELLALWPETSGNSINGLGESESHPPRPVFWRTDGESIAHTDALFHFYKLYQDSPRLKAARDRRMDFLQSDIRAPADEQQQASPEDWSVRLKAAALAAGGEADDIGITLYRPEWTFNDRPQPQGRWAVVLAFQHDYDILNMAPNERTYEEIVDQYFRAARSARYVAEWIRDRGFVADAKTGPMTEDVLMIPAAIESGLGELGKHGSMIHRKFGANFRLSMVTTDMPLIADQPNIFGADDFCLSCQVCTKACPPEAIAPDKQMVNGEHKWYVNFDKCLPYFIENQTCGICLAVCPWSRPGIADNLVIKMAKRRARSE